MRQNTFPVPFLLHPDGQPWEPRWRPVAAEQIFDAMDRFHRGEISEDELRQDRNREGIKFWLWYMHHKDDERRKCIGRPYVSHDAYITWRRYYFAVPEGKRLHRDGAHALCTIPKKSWAGLDGLHHEHVVPQFQSLDRIILEGLDPEWVIACNLDAVITEREARLLPRRHPNPDIPWLRYAGSGIKFVVNPTWTPEERAALEQYDLIYEGEIEAYRGYDG